MIIGNNFPSGSGSKVTVDGIKQKDKMELYSVDNISYDYMDMKIINSFQRGNTYPYIYGELNNYIRIESYSNTKITITYRFGSDEITKELEFNNTVNNFPLKEVRIFPTLENSYTFYLVAYFFREGEYNSPSTHDFKVWKFSLSKESSEVVFNDMIKDQGFLGLHLHSKYSTKKVLDYLMTDNGLYVIGYVENSYYSIIGLYGNLAKINDNKTISSFPLYEGKLLIDCSLSSDDASDDISKILFDKSTNKKIYYCSNRNNTIKDWDSNTEYNEKSDGMKKNFKPSNLYTYYNNSYYIDDTEAPKNIKRYQITFDDNNKKIISELIDTTSFYYQIIPATEKNQDE